MSKFKREERYIVVKLKDLDYQQAEDLRQFLVNNEIDTVDGVVIESDWPECEPAWALIEQRMSS
jgi:hypothetical protein